MGEVAGAKRVTERGFEEINVAPKATEKASRGTYTLILHSIHPLTRKRELSRKESL